MPTLPLPIDAFLPRIVELLQRDGSLVLTAEPGAGKTTRVPPALMDELGARQVLVLEPRRVAARLAAQRVACELGEEVGQRAGYEVRFERRVSARTRVRFVTEGVLTRKLITDPHLDEAAVVVLDEFHERSVQADLALALLRRLQRTRRPELRLLVMSATLDVTPLTDFLGCRSLAVPGRRHAVSIEHAERPDERPLEQRVAAAVRRVLREEGEGDVLVFLPGAAEIRRAREAVEPIAREHTVEIAVLHGDLPAREQDRALQTAAHRKLILSTNLAESSLTLPGVRVVIDSGLARRAGHSPWSGMPTLVTAPISQASATQRAGRAGRVRQGRCLRLYTRHELAGRPRQDSPEIARSDLADTLLAVTAIDAELSREDWLQPPPEEAWRSARALCRLLGALDAQGSLTPLGQRMLRYPLHPRLSRLLCEAHDRGVADGGALLCALLSERDIWLPARRPFDSRGGDVERGDCDLLDRLDRFRQAQREGFRPRALQAVELDSAAVTAIRRVRDRLRKAVAGGELEHEHEHEHEQLRMALLAGFGDRVGQRRTTGGSEIVLAAGGAARQSPLSVVRDAPLVVVLDAREQKGRGVVAHQLSAIEPEWLLELFPGEVVERHELRFDEKQERVEAVLSLRYGALTLDESKHADVPADEAGRVLFEHVRPRGLAAFCDAEALELFERRAGHAHQADAQVPALPSDARERALRAACEGRRSVAELRSADPLAHLRGLLGGAQLAALERLAPASVQLPAGRRLRVNYEPDRPPWVASRLQDFFGSSEGPRVGGRPLVLHLLAPNRRAVQVTTDLAGFWQRHYPELRRQLMRRYPKHDWPEDPLRAQPTPPRRPKR